MKMETEGRGWDIGRARRADSADGESGSDDSEAELCAELHEAWAETLARLHAGGLGSVSEDSRSEDTEEATHDDGKLAEAARREAAEERLRLAYFRMAEAEGEGAARVASEAWASADATQEVGRGAAAARRATETAAGALAVAAGAAGQEDKDKDIRMRGSTSKRSLNSRPQVGAYCQL